MYGHRKKIIKVLVVDDSSLVRQILSEGLAADPGIEVVGAAPDPFAARDMIVRLQPDVLTLDVEMPRMDGVEFLRRLMPQYPLPVIMVSSLTQKGKQVTMDALDAGAVDFVAKPGTGLAQGLKDMMMELRTKVKIAASANVSHWKHKRRSLLPSERQRLADTALAETTDKVIAIGASTGGTEAIRQVVTCFPAAMPGVIIVQHMPPGFTAMFAERLNSLCAMEVREARDGDRVRSGLILIGEGGKHLSLNRSGGIYKVQCAAGENVCGHCPSVEVLMQSVARVAGANAIGVMLTGMGRDGADGMVAMRRAGARTLAQDEKSSVVFGMPKEAWLRGGAERLVPLPDIGKEVIGLVEEMGRQT
ncbi:MAG: chemotaxis response regulator protein-glutamate methylesterase [Desulfobulbaceae bacterium]|nr:MAG: chemotaxis response regulator protein-glutamate methylesterase [Desulfobulbaceae bacterium]